VECKKQTKKTHKHTDRLSSAIPNENDKCNHQRCSAGLSLGILIKRKLDNLKKFSRKAGRIEGEKVNAIKVYQLPKL